MSASCENCKIKLSCGCKKRTASNGRSVCTSCLSNYEASLKNTAVKQSVNLPNITPSSVSVLYKRAENTI